MISSERLRHISAAAIVAQLHDADQTLSHLLSLQTMAMTLALIVAIAIGIAD